MAKLESIYPQVELVVKTFPGLSFRAKGTDDFMKSLTWKQFEKYQTIGPRTVFMSQSQVESISKSKKILDIWISMRQEALDFYLSHKADALKEQKENEVENNLILKLSKEPVIERGWDLSDVNLGKLGELFEKYSISQGCDRDEKQCAYIFSSYSHTNIEIRMGAHPFANGLLFNTTNGTRGEGYCSYIGIKGPESFVNDFIQLMRNHGDCKEYSLTPDYI